MSSVPDQPERRTPSPSLAIAGRYCFAFTFFQRLPARRGRPGVRVPALFEHARSQPALYHALVEPPLSFFRDIVDADQGPVSMPLVAAIDPVRGDPSLAPGAHDVDVTLPASLRYDAETRHVVLEPARAGGDRVLPLAFRDALAIFESGHVAYVFSLVPRPGRALSLTEYDVILLEKLVNPTEGCEYLRRELRWGRPGAAGESLVEFVNDRLGAAREASGRAPNAVRDLLYAAVLERGERVAPWAWAHLRSMAIVLDDRELQDATALALRASTPAGEAHAAGGNGEPPPGRPGEGARARGGDGGDAPGARIAGATDGGGHGAAPHMPGDRSPADRTRLALAGITQGILDFPEQDAAEIGDSLRPVLQGRDVEMFSHPRFLLEICSGSRSLAAMEGCLGCCPYVLLSHLVFAYNKRLLEEAEGYFEALRRRRSRRFRYRPFEALDDIIHAIDFPAGRPTHLLHTSLRIRFELLRTLIVSYIPNVFRYETERSLYESLATRHGLRGRYDTFVNWLEHYGDVVRGAHDLGQLLTDRRSNRLLLVIAVSGLLSVLKDALDLVGLGPVGPRFTVPLVATVATLVGVVVAREAWVLVQSRVRRRRALRDGVSDRLEPLDRDPGER